MDILVNIVLLTFLVVLALAIMIMPRLFSAVMLTGIFSLLSTCLYLSMDAVDVAFTEAAVGGGVATLLFIGTISATVKQEESSARMLNLPALLVVVLTGLLLIYGISDIPQFGSSLSPVQQYLSDRYVSQSLVEIGIPNMVTSILASYRGYDTMGEVTVIFTAGMAVLMLLGTRDKNS